MGDVVVDRAHLVEVQRPDLHLAELLDLAVAGEDPGSVGAQLAVLVDDAELDREPEDVGDELHALVGLGAARRLAGEPVELGELAVGEQVAVADHLVDQVGLGRVERRRGMADVLGRVELAVGEVAVELAHRDDPGGGDVAKAGQRLERVGDLVELRDPVGRQRERRLGLAERAAGVAVVLGRELALHRAPDLLLGLVVVDPAAPARRGSSRAPPRRSGCAAAGTRVGLARVIVGEVDGDGAVVGRGDGE